MAAEIATDPELLEQYRSGSESAFAQLVARHVDWVYSAARRRVGDAHIAEDVTQAVFMALAGNRRLGKSAIVSSWLFTVMRYTTSKAIRDQTRRRRHELAAAREKQPDTETSDSEWNELASHLDEAVGTLGVRDRQAILLRFYRRRSFAEVGEALGVSEEGARKRVARAIAKLRRVFVARGAVISETALAGAMFEHCAQSAPESLGASIAAGSPASPAGSVLYRAWLRGARFLLILRAAVILGAGVIASIAISQILSTKPPQAAGSLPTTQPIADLEPATLPSSMTFDELIAGMRRSEMQFKNVHIKNFQTTVETQARGQTQWVVTPSRFAGSAWYEADPRGRQRVYFSDYLLPSRQGAGPAIGEVLDASWDGRLGQEFMLAAATTNKQIRTRTVVLADDELDPPGLLYADTRNWTGVGYALQYWVMSEDRTKPMGPRRSFSDYLEVVRNERHFKPEIVEQKANGFDAVRLRFMFARGSMSDWFDPSRGFALVKEQNILRFADYARTDGSDVFELQQVSPGIWYPMRASMVRDNPPLGYLRYTYQAAEVVVNDPKFDPSIFEPKIPTGWLVDDQRGHQRHSYVTMEDGTRLEIHIHSVMPNMKAGVDIRPDGEGPPITRDPTAWW